MKWYILVALYVALFVSSGFSAYSGWLASRADLAFLIMQGAAIVAMVIALLVTSVTGSPTNGTSAGIGIFMMAGIAMFALGVVIPLIVLISQAWFVTWIGVALLALVAIVVIVVS